MPAGFYMLGDSGATQIDDTYRNYSIIASGSKTVTGTAGQFATTSVTVTAAAPIIAWSGNAWVCSSKVTRSGTSWTLELVVYLSSTSVTFGYYVFDQPSLITPGDFGIQVYNSSGVLTFDSTMKWARIAGILDTDANVSTPTDYSLPSGRSYAVTNLGNPIACVVNVVPVSGGPSDPPRIDIYQTTLRMMARASGASVSSQRQTIATGVTNSNQWSNPPPAGTYNRYGSLLALDITNY